MMLSVRPDTIARQRELGWPDFHPEDYCHRCGHRNLYSWHAPDDLWNRLRAATPPVFPDSEIICPQCFTEFVRDVLRLAPSVWHLVPEPPPASDVRASHNVI